MMSDDQKPPEYGWAHPPLPYVVTIRSVTDDDSAPRVADYHVVAYSCFEAILSATCEAGGSGIGESDKHKVLFIKPDMDAYWKMFGRVLEQSIFSNSKRKPA